MYVRTSGETPPNTVSNTPRKSSPWQDRYFVMPPEKSAKMMQSSDFWQFVISKSNELKRFDILEFGVKYYETTFVRTSYFRKLTSDSVNENNLSINRCHGGCWSNLGVEPTLPKVHDGSLVGLFKYRLLFTK